MRSPRGPGYSLLLAWLFATAAAQASPATDGDALWRHVDWLAADEREGREPGTSGHDAATDYIAVHFREAGVAPGGEEGGYLQRFEVPLGEGRVAAAHNVVAVVPGSDPRLAGEKVVVSAHYDHLGRGRFAPREEERGAIHPGADDNASGVAVLIGLAHELASAPLPRTLVLAAFSGEENGAVGSRHFLSAPGAAAQGIVANVNLDMVGRLGDGPVQVLGTETSPDWEPLIAAASRASGVAARSLAAGAGGSDQQSFINRDIPAVQIFTGGHADYHRPTDTADRIDRAGLAEVKALVAALVRDLTTRPQRPSAGVFRLSSPSSGAARRVSFGLMPDFGHTGTSVRVERVLPDSAALAAGLREGDLLVEVDGHEVRDLRHYSDLLKELQPGNAVPMLVLRDGVRVDVEVVPRETAR